MPKRKRLPEDEDSSGANAALNEGRPKRRRNDTTLVDTVQYIFDALRNKKKDDDTYLCEAFLRIPKKKTEPQYYEVIKKPIDMLKIQQKSKTDVYNDIDEFYADVKLLIDNAKLYYAKSTDEYKDACELWQIFDVAKLEAFKEVKLRQLESEEEASRSLKNMKRGRGRPPKSVVASSAAPMIVEADGPPMTMAEAVEELFGAIVTATDPEERIYSYDFLLLPPPDKYPKYYQVITKPIDLKTIGRNIQNNSYDSLESLQKDMNLLYENACTFNEPGSRIYKDAKALSRLTQIRKDDINHVLNAKKSVRLRSKQSPDGKKWSELVANLQDGDRLPMPNDESDADMAFSIATNEDDESDEDGDMDSPFWQLFLSAKSLTAPNDNTYVLCEPFLRLPNRRWHSDYYQEIKNPISMSQIRKKISKGDYHYLSELVEDFNLMFDNAQKYNRPDSRIYRDSVKLQKYVLSKAEDLPEVEEEGDSDMDSEESDGMSESKPKASQRPWTFKRRAKLLFKTLMDFMTDDGRQPIVAFIELPARKDYPNYYEVIEEPIDMEMIEAKIKSDQYASDDELVADFRLMFTNCRSFNEAGSQIYTDADILGKVLNDKLGELQLGGDAVTTKVKAARKNKYSHYLTMTKNIKLLYNSVRDYSDEDDRQLSEVFLKLPLKSLYPDYYEVIKQPIDLERILYKWKNGAYTSLDDIMSDLTLMFLNACRYNEPESQIYRDALTLQRVALQKRLELSSKDESVPNTGLLVQELLMSLFISVFNHQNEEGKYTSDSFAELPEYEVTNGQKNRALNFDIMKRRLDKGLYRRLDQFQEDLFSLFVRARNNSKIGSKLYNDSVTLQKIFLKVRDELCRNGSILKSRALQFRADSFSTLLQQEEEKKVKIEDTSDGGTEDEDSKASTMASDGSSNNCVSLNEVQYYIGDFVYLTPPEKNAPASEKSVTAIWEHSDEKMAHTPSHPSWAKRAVVWKVELYYSWRMRTSYNCEAPMLHIQRLFANHSGQQMVYGCRYYKPVETFHQPNRKFYEQEVFKTEVHICVPLTEVIGKCVVMSSLDYMRLKVENFSENDVYICENRYSVRNRCFKKIKAYPFTISETVVTKERPEQLELKRVDSIFKERLDRHKEELAEVEEETKIIRSPVPNVLKSQESDGKLNTTYQQYNSSIGPLKLGDFVYVRSVGVKSVRHVVNIWVTSQGNAYMAGTKYVHSYDVSIMGERRPFKAEVYLTSTQETVPISDVIGRCSVLHMKEYLTLRHTEITENDVFICEKFYDEMNQRLCTLQSGILKFDLPPEIYPDEIYYFWRPLNPEKFELTNPAIVKKPPKMEVIEADNEDSMDGRPASVASADSSLPPTPKPFIKKVTVTPKVPAGTGRRQITGYILFAGEIRKSVTQRNPEANFGEISRLVGIEWKRLTDPERRAFEDRAHQLNVESAERAQALLDAPPPPPTPASPAVSKAAAEMPLPSNPDVVYECLWDTCDYMYEDLADLYEHLFVDPNSHLLKVHTVFECSWRGCSRHKKTSLAPFPLMQRLLRHVREVHMQRNTGRVVPHHDRSRNMFPSTRRSILSEVNNQVAAAASPTPTNQSSALSAGKDNQYQITFGTPIQVNGVNGVSAAKPTQPIFVNPPPKTQRLLHSEAYIKYIENLDKPFVCPWDKQLSANQESTVIGDSGRIPAHWLGNGAGNHGNVINALWALREFMMKDSLGIAKIL